jgi:hypothetical protein
LIDSLLDGLGITRNLEGFIDCRFTALSPEFHSKPSKQPQCCDYSNGHSDPQTPASTLKSILLLKNALALDLALTH